MRKLALFSVKTFLSRVIVFTRHLTVQVDTHVTLGAISLQEELARLHLLSRNKVMAELTLFSLKLNV